MIHANGGIVLNVAACPQGAEHQVIIFATSPKVSCHSLLRASHRIRRCDRILGSRKK